MSPGQLTTIYVVDHLLASNISSVRSDAITRYIKFVAGLRSSPSMEVAEMFGVASNDVRTTTGRNLRLLKLDSGLDTLTSSSVKVKAVMSGKLVPVPDRDVWRLGYLAKLLEARGQAHYMGEETD